MQFEWSEKRGENVRCIYREADLGTYLPVVSGCPVIGGKLQELIGRACQDRERASPGLGT